MKAKLAVLISGGGTNLQAIIDAIEAGKIKHGQIEFVISNREGAYGLERAKKHGLKNFLVKRKDFSCQEDFENRLIALIDEARIDLIVLAGFMNILSENFVKHYENRIINIHPSLIPAFSGQGFYGIRVHEAAIRAGVKLSGATVHYVNELADGGKIIAQEAIEVREGDTAQSLQERILKEVEHKLYPRVIEDLSREIVKGRIK